MSILETGIYEIDTVNDIVYANRKRGKVKLKPNVLASGYQQLTIFKGRGKGIKEVVYLHQLVYLYHYGYYTDGYEIDHTDRNKFNNCHTNLVAKTPLANNQNRDRGEYPAQLKLIRSKEISDIKKLHFIGQSQQSIAKQLGLNRLSVRYIIKRIEAGLPLKHE